MRRMRWGEKAFLLLGFLLAFLGSTGRAGGLLVKEVRTFGRHEMAIDLGGQTSATVSILASDQPGRQLVLGKVANVTTQDWDLPERFGPSLMANKVILTAGGRKWANVVYDGNNYQVPVVIRAWASQGTILNSGLLIVSDAPTDRPDQASFRFELSARGSIPTWRFLLGFALWFVPGGQLGAIALWGSTSNTGSTTIALDPQLGTKTIYYTYTGCTAFSDYRGSFTLDPRGVPAGQAIVLNFQGWCGGMGAGNWARVSQAVAVPPDFHDYGTTQPAFTFEALGYRLVYRLDVYRSVEGPDDCANRYRDLYPARDAGGGINFVISGADCAANMWGAPGKPERSYTWMPTLTLYTEVYPLYPQLYFYDPRSGNSFGAPVSYTYSLSWNRRTFTYRPSPYISGNAYTVPASSRLPDGTTVDTQVPRFDIYGRADGMGIIQGNPIGVSLPPDLIIPPRNTKCTFENRTRDRRFTVYLLDPPGTYRPSSPSGGSVVASTYSLPAGATLRLPPGLYAVGEPNGNAVYPDDQTGLYVRGCQVMSQFGYYADSGDMIVTTDISPLFFAY